MVKKNRKEKEKDERSQRIDDAVMTQNPHNFIHPLYNKQKHLIAAQSSSKPSLRATLIGRREGNIGLETSRYGGSECQKLVEV